MLFPAGKYYIGDLCYVINDWNAFCEMTIKGNDVLDGEFPWKDKVLYTHGTAYGDGSFNDQFGHEYCVDAGLIGVLPFEYCDRDEHNEAILELGNVVEFKEPFSCTYRNGMFYIGHLRINTDPREDEDEVDYDDRTVRSWRP